MKNTPYSQNVVLLHREFEQLQEIEVTKIVKSMATTSCEKDVLPTTLLKDNLSHLIGVLMKLANMSLKQGVYTKSCKMAIIWPLLKKIWWELIHSNFRSMSNLLFFSKLVECCMLYRFHDIVINIVYFQHISLLIDSSTSWETALVK